MTKDQVAQAETLLTLCTIKVETRQDLIFSLSVTVTKR